MNTATPQPDSDVLIIGGGPAGSTAAILLARRGLSVTLLERERHPRFHIGESLLPMNMPIIERLGLMPALERIGLRKPGADFPAENARGYSVFRFDRALEPAWPHAFQVRRAEFDEMLFRHAAATPGVSAHEAVRANAVELRADGITARTTADGVDRAFNARYLVDASGRATLLGRQLGLVRRDRRHQSAALFAHYRGVERRPGEDEGNISVYRFAHGWIWLIPLRDGVTSIGVVCSPEHLRDRRGREAACLTETLASVPELAARLRGAAPCGNLHATGNYSYACTQFAGPRYVMAGDACAFVDPIFSSGVYLAMSGAERAADVVAGALAQPGREAALQRRYASHVRRGIDAFSWFIHRFNTDAMRRLFANPRNAWQVEQAIISMLAGDVHRSRVRVRLQLFRAIYYATALVAWPTAWRDWRRRVRARRGAFAGGTTSQDLA